MRPLTLSISAVERDTGLSKDTLRVWERRYGFPTPERDAIGERAYSLEQVEKLRIVNEEMNALEGGAGLGTKLKKAWLGARAGATFLRLYALPARQNELPSQIRLNPVW